MLDERRKGVRLNVGGKLEYLYCHRISSFYWKYKIGNKNYLRLKYMTMKMSEQRSIIINILPDVERWKERLSKQGVVLAHQFVFKWNNKMMLMMMIVVTNKQTHFILRLWLYIYMLVLVYFNFECLWITHFQCFHVI